MAASRGVVLLSTYSDTPFLSAQLRSFPAQTQPDKVLFWRDDRSTASFLAPLRAVHLSPGADNLVAFSDQDDVWILDKLARGVAALAAALAEVPTFYRARQVGVDAGFVRSGRPLNCGVHRSFPPRSRRISPRGAR